LPKKSVFSVVGALVSGLLTHWGLSWLFSKKENATEDDYNKKDDE